MIKKVFETILGSRHQRDVKKLQPLLQQIIAQESALTDLDDAALQAQTTKFRGLLEERVGGLAKAVKELSTAKHQCTDPVEREGLEGQLHKAEEKWRLEVSATLDDLLPEAFATVREACRRLMDSEFAVTGQPTTWNMIPYDVQMIGGINLHRGRITEMATGEGKTLVAVLPLYLNALPGRGAHLVTVNDYLARRDSQWMGHVLGWLGLNVACLDDTQPSSPERRAAYFADVLYGTNNEFGFDYLRDNMVFHLDQRVQREHIYAIIDEVDSILIDEARTPLIISGPVGDEDSTVYREHNGQVGQLVKKQAAVVSKLVAEGERLLVDEETRDQGGIKLYQAQLGMPKNKKLLKLFNEPGVQQLVLRTELDNIADRKLPVKQQTMREIEESLYFVLDEKGHSVHLTDRGTKELSPNDPELFVVPDISQVIGDIDDDPDMTPADKLTRRSEVEGAYAAKSEQLHIIHKLLQAHALYEKEVEYIVQDGQVLIVDENTGRIMHGRRWSDGLHQAVEAKEGVKVKGETQTFATITIQNYFRMYEKLSGMTGTAETEEAEFFQIYGLDVAVIPTNKPIIRRDLTDRIYKTRREKFNAVGDEVERIHELGWPVLIGTTSIDASETLSRQLKRRGLKHEVLNAKYHQREAEIIASAGAKGAITIATNMAGRGTDIKLAAELDLTIEKSGLHIVGTERHESRRIDRQLRGRAGRQGDPGESLFFLSLEDSLMRLFGGMDRISKMMDKGGAEEGEVITGKLITRAIESAQKRVELQNFQSRKRLLEYDDVMNQQREVIYSTRLFALERDAEIKAEALKMIGAGMSRIAADWVSSASNPEEIDREELREALLLQFMTAPEDLLDSSELPDGEDIVSAVTEEAHSAFKRKLEYFTEIGARIGVPDVDVQVISQVMLGTLDERWKDHLYDLDQLRNAIHYRAYGQKDPLVEYKKEAFEMFEDLLGDIQSTFAERLLKVQVNVDGPPPGAPPQAPLGVPQPKSTGGSEDLFTGAAPDLPAPPREVQAVDAKGKPALPPGATMASVPEAGRNEPCPCGSGKKYKKCHGR
jgi:preprotein translocase subunit SecA